MRPLNESKEMKSSNRRALVLTLIVLALIGAVAYGVRKFQTPATRTIHVAGVVVDSSTGQPIQFAHVQGVSEGRFLIDPVYTDETGSFEFSFSSSKPSEKLRLFVITKTLEKILDLRVPDTRSSINATIGIDIVKPTESAPVVETRSVDTRGPAEPSGFGSNWSGLYELCHDVEAGFTIEQATFRLEGDRSCGAWAECTPASQTPTRACWRFRLQGHNEGGETIRMSLGVMTTIEKRVVQQSPSPNAKYQVIVQYADDNDHKLAEALSQDLSKYGFVVPTAVNVPENFSTKIRYFHDEDQPAASKLAAKLTELMVASHTQVDIKVENGSPRGNVKTNPGQIEVWINTTVPKSGATSP